MYCMKVNFEEYKRVEILIDEKENIAIFSRGQLDNIKPDDDFRGFMVNVPVELKTPYTANELANAIEYAMSEEIKEPYFLYDQRINKTYEEVYYGIKGFNKVMKGKKKIEIGWNDRWGKYASLDLPDKRGYSYTGVKLLCLDDNADWIDFAESVITLVKYDPKNDK